MKVKHRISGVVIDLEDQDRIEIKDETLLDKIMRAIETNHPELRYEIEQILPKITDDMLVKICESYYSCGGATSEDLIDSIKDNLPKDLLTNPE